MDGSDIYDSLIKNVVTSFGGEAESQKLPQKFIMADYPKLKSAFEIWSDKQTIFWAILQE